MRTASLYHSVVHLMSLSQPQFSALFIARIACILLKRHEISVALYLLLQNHVTQQTVYIL